MKAKICPITFLIVLASLSFTASNALAKGIFSDWAFAVNEGNVPVLLHVKTGENKYFEITLEPGQKMVLPAGSQKVTAIPTKGWLDEGDQMKVAANLFMEDFWKPSKCITEPGKSITFARPSIAVTPETRKDMKEDVVFAPGALAPAEEKKEAPNDDKELLLEQNKIYTDKKKRLEEIDPNGAEAEAIRDALKTWEKDLERMTKQAEAKYGTDWREQYRDSSGKLPGGFIEDDKSQLIKLQERRKEQQDKVDRLRSEFEELKKRLKTVEPRWEDRLTKDQREFREKFIEEHGPSDTWNEETRKKYADGFNELTKKSKQQWEKDKAEQSEVNRAIGRKIKEIAHEHAELNSLERKTRRLEAKQKAKKPADEKAEAKEDAAQEDEDTYYIMVDGEPVPFKIPTEEATKHQLLLKPAIVRPGEKLTLTYQGAPGNDSDWINLAETSWPAEQNGEYYYLEGRKEGTLTFTAPEAGTFEARLYENWPFGGHKIIAKSNTVKAVLPSGKDLILRPTRVQTGEPVILSFAGTTDNQNVWVTLVKVTAVEQEYQQVYHLDGQTQGTFRFTAPEPSEYEVRLLKVTENKIIGRSNPITVIEKEQKKEETKEEEKFTLRTTTKTANNELADMDGGMRVFVSINGEGEHRYELDDPEDDFEPGAVDVFDREFNYPLAEVKFILLDADGSDEWQCESISFQFIQGDKKSQVYTFNINTWFSTEQSDIEKLGAVKTKRFDIRP